jgi:Ca2+-binding RTX toxin-like protein
MKRILLLVTVALMLAAAMALSGVAQAAPISDKADAQCAKLGIKTLGSSFNPSNYTFHGGSEGNDIDTFTPTAGPDVFCGFGGDDTITTTLAAGDIFLGGAGNDSVSENSGTFYGGDGNDSVFRNGGVRTSGIFYGGAGNDYVDFNTGTFNGGDGNDFFSYNYGTFNQA